MPETILAISDTGAYSLVEETENNLVIQEIHHMFSKGDLKKNKVGKGTGDGTYRRWYVRCGGDLKPP